MVHALLDANDIDPSTELPQPVYLVRDESLRQLWISVQHIYD